MKGTVNILGVPFSKLTLNETVEELADHIQQEQPKLYHLITANPEITITSKRTFRVSGEENYAA